MPTALLIDRTEDAARTLAAAAAVTALGTEIRGVGNDASGWAAARAGDDAVVVVALEPGTTNHPADLALAAATRSVAPTLIILMPGGPASPVSARSGAIHWIGRSAGSDALGALIGAIATRQLSPLGTVGDMAFEDVFRLCVTTSWSGRISARYKQSTGYVAFQNGRAVDAVFGADVGQAALVEIFASIEGALLPESGVLPQRRTIQLEADALLSEVVPVAEALRQERIELAGWELPDEDIAAAMAAVPAPGAPDLFSGVNLDDFAWDDGAAVARVGRRGPG